MGIKIIRVENYWRMRFERIMSNLKSYEKILVYESWNQKWELPC